MVSFEKWGRAWMAPFLPRFRYPWLAAQSQAYGASIKGKSQCVTVVKC